MTVSEYDTSAGHAGGDATVAPDLRSALRAATHALHRRLDHAPEQRALLAPELRVEHYLGIMTRHRRALAESEAVLSALEHARPSALPAYRPRLDALDADIVRLQGGTHAHAGSEAPTSGSDGVLDADVATGRYLGTRYVLEGSTQGAAAIARRLEHHLPALRRDAFAYWDLQADETERWHALANLLAALPASDRRARAAIDAARDAFGAFLRAFDIDRDEGSEALS